MWRQLRRWFWDRNHTGGPFFFSRSSSGLSGLLGIEEWKEERLGLVGGGRRGQRWRALTLYSSLPHLIWLEVIYRTATEEQQSPWAKTPFMQRIMNQPKARNQSENTDIETNTKCAWNYTWTNSLISNVFWVFFWGTIQLWVTESHLVRL